MTNSNVLYPDFPIYFGDISVVNNSLQIQILKNSTKEISKYSLKAQDETYIFAFDNSKKEQIVTIQIDDNFTEPVFENVWFCNGEIISFDNSLNGIHIIKPRSIHTYGLERYYYKREISKKISYPKKNIKFVAEDYGYYWNCLCGNQIINNDICDCCGTKKEKVFKERINIETEAKKRIGNSKLTIYYFFLTLFCLAINLIYTSLYGTPLFKNYLNNSVFGVFNIFGLSIISMLTALAMFYASQTYKKELYIGLSIFNYLILLYINIIMIFFPLLVSYAYFLYLMLDIVSIFIFILSLKSFGLNYIRLSKAVISFVGLIISIISMNRFTKYNIEIDNKGIYLKEKDTNSLVYNIKEELNGLPITRVFFSSEKKYSIKTFNFSKNLEEIVISYASNLDTVEDINLNNNDYFYLLNGVVYNRKTNKVVLISNKIENLELDYEEIIQNSFLGAKNLKNIIIGPNVKKIGKNAFERCSNLETIDFTVSNIETIEEKAFKDCVKLASLNLPISLKKLGSAALEGTSSLNELKMPFIGEKREDSDNLSSSRDFLCYSFGGPMYSYSGFVPSTLKKITIYDITRIHNVTFYDLEYVEEIIISSELNNVGVRSFYKCKNLKSLIIDGSFEEIYESMFDGCESLSEIKIPSSVKKIDKNAFKNCYSLTKIIYDGNKDDLVVADENILDLIVSE